MRMLALRELRWAVEKQHGCKAVPVGEVTVHERQGKQTLWYGIVTVFELHGHPTAQRAYAWYYELPGGAGREFLSALHLGPVKGPADAIRAAIAAMK
jgi:hypothetical protein